jgi:hypothetical protein
MAELHGTGSIGVTGDATETGGIGVLGQGLEAESIGMRAKGKIGVIAVANSSGTFGVYAHCGPNGNACGVLGESQNNRAGVFHHRRESSTSNSGLPNLAEHVATAGKVAPHICLVAVELADSNVAAVLPRSGIAGDLLAVIPRRAGQLDEAQLWFCVRTGSNVAGTAGASWSQIRLGNPVDVP